MVTERRRVSPVGVGLQEDVVLRGAARSRARRGRAHHGNRLGGVVTGGVGLSRLREDGYWRRRRCTWRKVELQTSDSSYPARLCRVRNSSSHLEPTPETAWWGRCVRPTPLRASPGTTGFRTSRGLQTRERE